MCMCVCVCTYTYTYTYIYMKPLGVEIRKPIIRRTQMLTGIAGMLLM